LTSQYVNSKFCFIHRDYNWGARKRCGECGILIEFHDDLVYSLGVGKGYYHKMCFVKLLEEDKEIVINGVLDGS